MYSWYMSKLSDKEQRPNGTSSRLSAVKGIRPPWEAPNGQQVDLPVILDLVHVDQSSGATLWKVEARVDLVCNEPRLTEMHVSSSAGLDVVQLQHFFRWATPLDVIMRTVPELLERGIDPFAYEYPVNGYPDAADIGKKPTAPHSDDFLEDVARQYLDIGRGYARQIARQHHVSERTVVSWIEKARKRGILSSVKKGQFGGKIVPRNQREKKIG